MEYNGKGSKSVRVADNLIAAMGEREDNKMDFFEKIEETITTKGQMAVDKAKELAEIASLKSQIGTCEEVIKKNYIEIGRIYYENFGDNAEEIFARQCRNIKNAKKGVEELEVRIKEIKGL